VTRRVGLLGGTFDPPHSAHLVMAQTARDALGLDRVLLIPAPRPPHKAAGELSPFSDRIEMARAAAAAVDGVEVSQIESEREGPSYTVDTLRACREQFGGDLYFIMGTDSLRDLPTWREPEEILKMCTLVVFPRDDIPARLALEGDASLVVFESPRIDISSTEIRERCEQGDVPDEAIPDAVRELIRSRGLYRKQ